MATSDILHSEGLSLNRRTSHLRERNVNEDKPKKKKEEREGKAKCTLTKLMAWKGHTAL